MSKNRLMLLLGACWLITPFSYGQNQSIQSIQGGSLDGNLLPGAGGGNNSGSTFLPELFNGTSNVTIPIYSNGDDGISLIYNTAGVKVDESGEAIGNHWNLAAGGSITRVMKDVPDDMNIGTNQMSQVMGSGNPAVSSGIMGRWAQYGLGVTGTPNNDIYMDEESDDFIFSAGGLSFTFNIGQNGYVFTRPGTSVKIELLLNGQPVTTSSNKLPIDPILGMQNISFRVRDAQGNWYYFQKGDVSHAAYGAINATDLTFDYISKWVLQKVIHNNGQEVNYSYTTKDNSFNWNIVYMSYSGYEQNNPSYLPSPSITTNANAEVKSFQVLTSFSYLTAIKYPNNVTANFIYTVPTQGRCDDPGNSILSEIQIVSTGTGLRYVFDQVYALSKKNASDNIPLEIPIGACTNIDVTPQYNNNYKYHRLFLKGIRVMSMDGTQSEPYYTFQYNTAQRLPPKLSGAQDYFGYYNGKVLTDGYGGMFTIPSHTTRYGPTPVTYGVDKSDDWTYAVAGLLNTVQNAYGGKTIFGYGGHVLSNVYSNIGPGYSLPTDNYFKGTDANDGVRLEYILTTDDHYPGKFQKQTFAYSGGQRFMPGGYFDYPVYTIRQGSNNSVNLSPNTSFYGTFVSPHQFINGSNHGYSQVTITTTNDAGQALGKTVVNFNNLSRGYQNTSYYMTGAAKYFQLPYTNKQYIKDWELGLPLVTTQYDQFNNILSVTTNTYKLIIDSTSAIGTLENIKRQSTTENGVPTVIASDNYRPYSGMSLLAGTTVQKFVDDYTSTSDVVTYSYDSHNNLQETSSQNSRGETNTVKNIYNYNISGSSALSNMSNAGLELKVSMERWKKTTSSVNDDQLMDANITRYSYQNGLLSTQKLLGLQSLNPIAYTAYSGTNNIQNVYNPLYTQPIPNFGTVSEVLQFDSKGNPVETQLKGQNIYASMIWDAVNNNKLAEVQNARLADIGYTSFERLDGISYTGQENSTSGGFSYNQWGNVDNVTPVTGKRVFKLIPTGSSANYYINSPVLTSGKSYVMTYWCNGSMPVIKDASGTILSQVAQYTLANGWKHYRVEFIPALTGVVQLTASSITYIDEIRVFPAGAMMKSWVYTPLFGATSSTDPSGRITYYEYDALGKQVVTRDQEGNVISKKEYRIGL